MSTTPNEASGANNGKKAPESFGELLRKFALASVGAVVLAQEEIEEFVRRLVEKGELAEKDGRTLVRDLLEKRKRALAERGQVLADPDPVVPEVDRTIDRVLHKINVPTKTDVEELSRKIDEIEKKIDALAAAKK